MKNEPCPTCGRTANDDTAARHRSPSHAVLIAEIDDLRRRNAELERAVKSLTKIESRPDGAVVVDPRGWELVQKTLEAKP